MWDLVPWPETKPRSPALGSQIHSHRTAREILQKLCLLNHSWSKIWSREVIGAHKYILAWRFVCRFQSVSWGDSKPREGSKMALVQIGAERLRHTSPTTSCLMLQSAPGLHVEHPEPWVGCRSQFRGRSWLGGGGSKWTSRAEITAAQH